MGVAGAGLLMAVGASQVHADTDGKVLYGIDRDNASLIRYDFGSHSLSTVGTVRSDDVSALTDMDAAAHIPGHQNIYGFWTDPDEGLVHLVYINAETAAATIIGDDLDHGKVTGATAAQVSYIVDDHDDHDDDGDDDDDHGDHDDDDHGHGNDDDGVDDDNPGNSDGVNENGMGHGTHDDDHGDHDDDDDDDHGDHDDDDHESSSLDAGLGWSVFAVQTLEDEDSDDDHGDHDDHGHGNDDDGVDDDNPGNSDGVDDHGMGHGAHDGDGVDDHGDHDDEDHPCDDEDDGDGDDEDDCGGDLDIETGYRLIQVDHHSGDTTELMSLTREYDGLATTDGVTFFATSGTDLYRIDPTDGTETLVDATGLDLMFGLAFADATLMGYENVNDHLVPIDLSTGAPLGSPMNLGTSDLGTIIFIDAATDPMNQPGAFD